MGQIVGGMKLVKQDTGLAGVFVITAIYNLVGWPAVSMAPVIAKGGFGLTESQVGLMVSLDGMGAFLAALALRHWAPADSYGRIFCASMVFYLVMMVGFAASANPAMAGIFLFASGFGGAGFAVMQVTLIYLLSSPETRGLILGLLATCIGLSPLGVLHIGVLAEIFGAQKAVIIMGVEGLVLTALTLKLWRGVAGVGLAPQNTR
ncbi:MAG: MFS transporter [Hyphomonadaceae bacterium]